MRRSQGKQETPGICKINNFYQNRAKNYNLWYFEIPQVIVACEINYSCKQETAGIMKQILFTKIPPKKILQISLYV